MGQDRAGTTGDRRARRKQLSETTASCRAVTPPRPPHRTARSPERRLPAVPVGRLRHILDAALSYEEATDDGIGTPEGAFLLCSFDMVSALVLAGRSGEAGRRLDHLCANTGELGIHTEETAQEGTQLGDFPQAFTHVVLIETAANPDAAGDREAPHARARDRTTGQSRPRRPKDEDDEWTGHRGPGPSGTQESRGPGLAV
ncbi:hypothetical protein GCM10009603_27160 [Nocardiopsis exhalans]